MSQIRNIILDHVRACQEQGNQARQAELEKLEPRLSVSQIGHCPRQAIFEAARYHPEHPLHADPTHPFDDYVQEVIEAGNLWEKQTGKALAYALGDSLHWQKDDPALRVMNEYWSGHIDFLVDPCPQFPVGAVIEHKATSPNNFKYGDRLPYPFHCLQVLAYERLLRQKLDRDYITPCYLYYRSWSNWAELAVEQTGDGIAWFGEINGTWKEGFFADLYLEELMNELEDFWRMRELPPRYETPVAVPFTCAKAYKHLARPSCRYFGVCWPELPQAESFDVQEWKEQGQ